MWLLVAVVALADDVDDALARQEWGVAESLIAARLGQGGHMRQIRDAYNLAAARSHQEDVQGALEALALLERLGFTATDRLRSDEDLAFVAADPRFTAISERMRAGSRDSELNAFATPFREELPVAERVAGLSVLWSEVRQHFVYFDGRGSDWNWDERYLQTLDAVMADSSTEGYYRILGRLVAEIGDGHTDVWPPSELEDRMYGRPSIETVRLRGEVYVSDVVGKVGLQRGDQILAVAGLSVDDWAAAHSLPYTTASTPQDRDEEAYGFRRFLVGPVGETVTVTASHTGGKPFEVVLERTAWHPPRPPLVQWRTRGKVGILELNSFDTGRVVQEVDALWPKIAAQQGLIIDLRTNGGGNSSVGFEVLSYLAEHPFATGCWSTREARATDRPWGVGTTFTLPECSTYPDDGARHYQGPVVLLIGPRTFSAAEDFVVAFEAMGRGPTIGATTGGSTGQPVSGPLPGGGSFRVCAKRDTRPDGQPFVGIGIVPMLPIGVTPEDLRKGRDPVLEAGLSTLKASILTNP